MTSPLVAAAAADYRQVREEVLYALTTYTDVIFKHFSKTSQWDECLVHATRIGESAARFQNMVPQLLADEPVHSHIFIIRKSLEFLEQMAKSRSTKFTMPHCYETIRSLTKRIHEFRGANQALPSAINTASSNNGPTAHPLSSVPTATAAPSRSSSSATKAKAPP
ncbi:hypothetical protein EV360DRAFT_90937, partial [Lentinula raphanica]